MHAFKLSVVRLSSSMTPIFKVFSSKLSAFSTKENSFTVNATSSGP